MLHRSKGLMWIAGAFLICPCHLPLTLGVASAALGGTAVGWYLRQHPILAGLVLTISWGVATAYGFRLLQNECDVPPSQRSE